VSLTPVQTDKAPAAIGPYSQGIVANGFLFTAGQIALDPISGQIVAGDVVAQAERVLANLKAILDTAGASWSDVVKTTVYLHDMNDFPRVIEGLATDDEAGIGPVRQRRERSRQVTRTQFGGSTGATRERR